jgi:hypothetical protein
VKHHPRLDANQPAIVGALRRLPGVTVYSTAGLGNGFPDIAVGYKGTTTLWELKDPAKPPSARKLAPMEAVFFEKWTGHAAVALCWEDIAKAIGHPVALALEKSGVRG